MTKKSLVKPIFLNFGIVISMLRNKVPPVAPALASALT